MITAFVCYQSCARKRDRLGDCQIIFPERRSGLNYIDYDIAQTRKRSKFYAAMQTDDVTDTVSYAEVYEAVKKEMEIPSKLLEHVGGRIVKRLFGDFPPIEDIELKLSKRNPPMGADIEAAGIEIHTSRQQQ